LPRLSVDRGHPVPGWLYCQCQPAVFEAVPIAAAIALTGGIIGDRIQDLLTRIEELEERVKKLEDK
jgi:sugar-specific transcriptional regulator TrmB